MALLLQFAKVTLYLRKLKTIKANMMEHSAKASNLKERAALLKEKRAEQASPVHAVAPLTPPLTLSGGEEGTGGCEADRTTISRVATAAFRKTMTITVPGQLPEVCHPCSICEPRALQGTGRSASRDHRHVAGGFKPSPRSSDGSVYNHHPATSAQCPVSCAIGISFVSMSWLC